MKKICIIDNYDSFTYNIIHLLEKIDEKINLIVLKNVCTIEQILYHRPDKLIISPGPGSPKEAGNCFEILKYFKEKLPILGICLGHQIIAEYFGSTISNANFVIHGKRSTIKNSGNYIFRGVKKEIQVARYHSLSIKKLSNELEILAFDKNDKEIMAIKHKSLALFGIQFHPESFLTESGDVILKNFLAS